jgi:hypothetical protein
MNDEKLRELFTDAEPVDEPPLAPGYLAATTAAADRAVRHRRLRRMTVGGVAVLALAATGLVVQPHLPGTAPRLTGAAAGGGRYDPLVSRLAPKWIPSGATSWKVGTTQDRLQSLSYMRSVPDPNEPGAVRFTWIVQLTLFAPGERPVPGRTSEDGPLEGLTFGSGQKVDPVQGMPAELLADPNGYTLEWAYPSGAHAVVTIPRVGPNDGGDTVRPGETAGTGFGDRTPAVARRIAENLRVDGHTPLKFPFRLRLPAGQHVISAGTGATTSSRLGGMDADLTVGSDRPITWSTVRVNSDIAPGKHVTVRHGFMLTVVPARGVDANTLTRGLQIFGEPRDTSTWRADPVLP